MTVSGISSSPANTYQNNPVNEFRQTFADLVKSIKSGDLQSAQQAYASLAQLQSNGAGPPANANSPFNQALSQIGQALQNGDISGAQQALAALAQQAQGSHHHHHHHQHADSDADSAANAPPNAPPPSGVGATLDVTA
jgi:hypothetical protein